MPGGKPTAPTPPSLAQSRLHAGCPDIVAFGTVLGGGDDTVALGCTLKAPTPSYSSPTVRVEMMLPCWQPRRRHRRRRSHINHRDLHMTLSSN